MNRLILAVSLLMFLTPLANGQELYSTVIGNLNGVVLCTQTGTDKASCSGSWTNSDGSEAAGVTAAAHDKYGEVSAGAGVVLNCSTDCFMQDAAQAQAFVSDGATLQGVPSSGAYFAISVAMSGSWTDRNYDMTELELQINGYQAYCLITSPNGNCTAKIPISQDGTVGFAMLLANSATAVLQGTGGNGTLSEGLSTTAKITKLAVVDQAGQVLKNVIITAVSGHQYPVSGEYPVHNSWSSGEAMPVAVKSPATGVIHGKIYVVGGVDSTGTVVATNQVYDPISNTWSTGADAVLPATTYGAASAVVGNTLYVISGTTDGTTLTDAVWAYNQKTNTWSSAAAIPNIPTPRVAAAAVVENGIIYVIGGLDANFNSLGTVESYNPATNTWSSVASLPVAKGFHSAALLGSTIAATGGQTSVGVYTGDNEGYNASADSWSSMTADPTPRGRACASSINGLLYVAGGYSGGTAGTPALTLNESFDLSTDSWATLASMPQGSQGSGSATFGGRLYCFGGEDAQAGTVIGNVQIYHP